MDFGMQNFLERISFKNPKGEERVRKAIRVWGADVEEPVTKVKSGREEEDFMNWYVERWGKKEEVEEDDMSDIANEIIEKEMKNVAGEPDIDSSVDLEDGEAEFNSEEFEEPQFDEGFEEE